MIVAIMNSTQYGSQGKIGINHLSEMDEEHTAYAHSIEEALTWAKQSAGWDDVEPESLGDGRQMLTTEWSENTAYAAILFGHENVTHSRQRIVIYPVNTVFVTVGYGAKMA